MKYVRNAEHTEYLTELEKKLLSVLEKVRWLKDNNPFGDENIKGIAMGLFEAMYAWEQFKDVPTYAIKDDE